MIRFVALALIVFVADVSAAATRDSIAVAPFTSSSSGEYQWIGPALAEAVSVRLQRHAAVNTLSLRQVAAASRQLGWLRTVPVDTGGATRLGRMVGATLVITGSVHARWPDVEIMVTAVDPAKGEVRKSFIVKGFVEQLLELETLVAKNLVDATSVKFPSDPGAMGTTSLYAWRAYTMAREMFARQSLSPKAAAEPARIGELERKRVRGLLRSALELDPSYREARAAWAALDAVEDHPKEAHAAIAQLRADGGPFVPMISLASSFAHARGGDHDAAAKVLNDAITKYPGFLHPRGYLGELWALRGEHQRALAVFDAYVERAPVPWALVQRGYSRSKLGDVDGAIADTQNANRAAPGVPSFELELASRYIDGGKFDDAARILDGLLNTHPDLSVAYVRLGFVKLKQGDDRRAITLNQRAVSYGTDGQRPRDLAYAHLNMGQAHGRLGRTEKALDELEKAVAIADVSLEGLQADPKLKKLRKHPRFTALLARRKAP